MKGAVFFWYKGVQKTDAQQPSICNSDASFFVLRLTPQVPISTQSIFANENIWLEVHKKNNSLI